jgi:SNF2 family DNA or RNA helicase
MAHGLTLTASYCVVWYSPIPSNAIYEQANGRIRRIGQNHTQTIVHLQCSEIEKQYYARLEKKEKMQGLLLDILKSTR